jgi:hypothetical protein
MFGRMKRRQDFATALLLAGVVLMLCGCIEGVKSRGTYMCPMHPEVKSETPGQCPICKMDLKPIAKPVRTERSSPPAGSHAGHMY